MEPGVVKKVIAHKHTEIRSLLIFAMCCGFIVQFVSQSPVLELVLAAFVIIVFLLSLSQAKLSLRLVSGSMFAIGIILQITKGFQVETASHAVLSNLSLVAMILLAPLLSVPLKTGGMLDTIISNVYRLAESPKKLFTAVTVVLFTLAPITNLGLFRMVHDILKDLKLPGAFLSKAYAVGFGGIILWSPYLGSVALVLFYLQVSLLDYIPYGFMMALIYFAVGHLFFRFWLRKHHVVIEGGSGIDKGKREKLGQVLIFLIVLFGSLFVLEYVTHWPMTFLISIMSLVFPLLWCLLHRQQASFLRHTREYVQGVMPLMNNEIVLLLSTGFLAQSLSGTAFADWIQLFFNHLAATSVLLFIVGTFLIIYITAFIGIHPFVVIGVFVTQFDPAALGTSPAVIAFMLLCAWSFAGMISPMNGYSLLLSGMLKQSPSFVSFQSNGVFMFTMTILAILITYAVY